MPKTITLTLPTTNMDGSPIPAGELVDVQIGLGTTSGKYTLIADDRGFAAESVGGVVTIPWAELNETLAVGTWFAAARVVSDQGQTSDWSDEASFAVAPPVPNKPTGFSVA